MDYKAVVIGSSAGGLDALRALLTRINRSFSLPIVIVQHLSPLSDNYLSNYLDNLSDLRVKEVEEKERIEPGIAYIAPPNYHVLIEENRTFALTVDEKVNYARPSVDVLFESAAYVYRSSLIGIVLTGANNDGSKGLKIIKQYGGLAIVQDPKTAYVDTMPRSAMETVKVDHVLNLEEIADFLNKLRGEV
ncbi:MAG: chemotaxis protein CheB [Bacteroidales bacterium]|nr:chemotaxis protein CheB [Bacteroidales bacterium]